MRLVVGGIYQGKNEFVSEKYGDTVSIFHDVLKMIENLIDKGMADEAINLTVHEAIKYDVVIAEEIYCGLTPIDSKERLVIETYGRTLEILAKEAESVERIVCGMAIALK